MTRERRKLDLDIDRSPRAVWWWLCARAVPTHGSSVPIQRRGGKRKGERKERGNLHGASNLHFPTFDIRTPIRLRDQSGIQDYHALINSSWSSLKTAGGLTDFPHLSLLPTIGAALALSVSRRRFGSAEDWWVGFLRAGETAAVGESLYGHGVCSLSQRAKETNARTKDRDEMHMSVDEE